MVEKPKYWIPIYKLLYQRADWARSPDEGCVNRLYRAIRQLLRMKK